MEDDHAHRRAGILNFMSCHSERCFCAKNPYCPQSGLFLSHACHQSSAGGRHFLSPARKCWVRRARIVRVRLQRTAPLCAPPLSLSFVLERQGGKQLAASCPSCCLRVLRVKLARVSAERAPYSASAVARVKSLATEPWNNVYNHQFVPTTRGTLWRRQ